MLPKKSLVSHTILAHSKQHLHNKKGKPNREHRCGAGQILFECQVRTSHNSRVLEMGKLCVPWFVRILGLLQQQRIDIPSLIQKSFPYRSLFGRIWWNPFLIGILFQQHQTWRTRHFLIYAIVGSKQTYIRIVSLPHSFQLYGCQLIDGVSLLVRPVNSLYCPYQISARRHLSMEADGSTYNRQLMP